MIAPALFHVNSKFSENSLIFAHICGIISVDFDILIKSAFKYHAYFYRSNYQVYLFLTSWYLFCKRIYCAKEKLHFHEAHKNCGLRRYEPQGGKSPLGPDSHAGKQRSGPCHRQHCPGHLPSVNRLAQERRSGFFSGCKRQLGRVRGA